MKDVALMGTTFWARKDHRFLTKAVESTENTGRCTKTIIAMTHSETYKLLKGSSKSSTGLILLSVEEIKCV